MSDISSLNGLVQGDASKLSQSQATAVQNQKSQQTDTTGGQEAYGPPYILSISEGGQAYLSSGSGASGASANAAAPTGVPLAGSTTSSASGASSSSGSGTGGPVSVGASTSETELEEEAKRKVEPQVGAVGANEVVDKNGNIDEIKLKELIAQLDVKANAAKGES